MSFDSEREQVFDQMAARWDEIMPPLSREKFRELIALAEVQDKTVLDVGAGTGVLVEAGLAAAPRLWIACDLSSEMLKKLGEKFKDRIGEGVLALLHADVHSLPLAAASVDRVICHNVFPHFRQPKGALAELHRVLRHGGLLIINHFAGREMINRVHRSAPHAVLHEDLLAPGEEAAGWLEEAGFVVTGVTDSPELYRLTALRRPAG